AVHEVHPDLPIFPSIQLESLAGFFSGACSTTAESCVDDGLAQIADLRRDSFAVSVYPFLAELATGSPWSPDDLPRIFDRVDEPIVIAETGTLATPLDFMGTDGTCAELVSNASEEEAARWLQHVVDLADAYDMELATWWSGYDVLPVQVMTSCPCEDGGAGFCDILDFFVQLGNAQAPLTYRTFGTMGIYTYEGTPRTSMVAILDAARD
ncbi:MAG: hypothetical protein KDA28_14335, partial [Phycisphaerales bacterium]|nr:hypothetical protein [Phycisphaerales bacterium]